MGRTAWFADEHRSIGALLGSISWTACIAAALIGMIGVMTLYSVAGGTMAPWAMTHVTRLLIGFALMFVVAAMPARVLMALAYPAYIGTVALLGAVAWLGVEASGAQRWLAIGPISFQPSEVAKIAVVFGLARFYHALPPGTESRARNLTVPLLLIAVPVALVLRQPDLGTAVLIGCVGLGVMFLAGVNLAYFVGGAAATAAALPFVWSRLHDYQRDRILIFLDPESDMLGKGYQITQSKIALGSGGFAGKGFLQGTQSQLDFVPEKHTDFIFTMFAEEMGFLGCMLLIMLYGVLIWTLVVMALRCRSVFGRLVIMGLAAMLSLHVFINIAMTAGAVPVVGVPLPLMSYGGSSLFATMIGLGLAMNAFVNRAYTLTSRDSATQFGR